MEPTYFAQYRGFEFRCSPERLGDDTFAPRLIVRDASGPHPEEFEVAIGGLPLAFSNATVAAHYAFRHGRLWVDEGIAAARAATGPGDRIERLPALLENSRDFA